MSVVRFKRPRKGGSHVRKVEAAAREFVEAIEKDFDVTLTAAAIKAVSRGGTVEMEMEAGPLCRLIAAVKGWD